MFLQTFSQTGGNIGFHVPPIMGQAPYGAMLKMSALLIKAQSRIPVVAPKRMSLPISKYAAATLLLASLAGCGGDGAVLTQQIAAEKGASKDAG